MAGDFCELKCYVEPNCVSYNLKKVADERGRYKCELNNSTFEGQENKLETNPEYIYRGAKVSLKYSISINKTYNKEMKRVWKGKAWKLVLKEGS